MPTDKPSGARDKKRMSRIARGPAYTEIQRAIGERMRWARELVEPNCAAFARDCGVHPSTLLKVEDGDRAPTVFVIRDYVFRLRVSADFLLFGKLGGGDRELEALLVAHHPEILLNTAGKDNVEPNKALASGTDRQPKKQPKARLD